MQNAEARIWYIMFDAERLSRYYGKISDKFQRFHQWASLSTIILSVLGAVGLSLDTYGWQVWAMGVVFIALTVITAFTLVSDSSRKAETARIASRQIRVILGDARDVWTRRAKYQEDLLATIATELEEKLNAESSTDLIIDVKLNAVCQKEANSVLEAEFSRTGGEGVISASPSG